MAIERRKWPVVKMLLECGADPKLSRVEYVQTQRRKSGTYESNVMRVIERAFDDDTLVIKIFWKIFKIFFKAKKQSNCCLMPGPI